ncbi:MAG: ATP-grasp domain-containing protein [Rhodocyclales bacterium]|nr:ATP-grasp domain-containing protein [Rhodocyclales bacterium]
MKMILVSGASGIVGYGVLRSLKSSGMDLRLIGTSIYGDSVAPRFCDIFELAPHTHDPSYMPWLLNTIASHKVDLVIPGIEIDLHAWAAHAKEIDKSGAVAMLNKLELVSLCQDKWLFHERLRSIGMPCRIDSSLGTEYAELAERFGLPFLLKPRRGFGGRGIVQIGDEAAFLRQQANIGPILMAQPIVGNEAEEFTSSAFCDGKGGFHACMTLRRKLSRDGYTEKAEVVASDEFIATMSSLCQAFEPVGPTNFQFRIASGDVKLLEINPRISSSTSIRTAFGYNESAMAADYFLERRTPQQPVIRRGRAVRYTEDCIFYEDSLHL